MKNELDMRLARGASWFYWIAGLTVINVAVWALGFTWAFVVGLGAVYFAAGLASGLGAGSVAAYAMDAGIIAAFLLFGYFANKRHLWAFIVGMAAYMADGMLFLAVKDWFALAFHAFVLIMLFRGLSACLMMRQNENLTRDMMIRASLTKDAEARPQPAAFRPASPNGAPASSPAASKSVTPWRPFASKE